MKSIEEKFVEKYFNKFDRTITNWMAENGITILRIGLGMIFFWFGILKFFPGVSPAEELVKNTVYFIDPDLFLPILAAWETLIGIGLITGEIYEVYTAAFISSNARYCSADSNFT